MTDRKRASGPRVSRCQTDVLAGMVTGTLTRTRSILLKRNGQLSVQARFLGCGKISHVC